VAVEQAAPYACEDANYCLQVHQVLWPQITASPALLHIYELEMATSAVLLRMERTGVAIDARQLAVQGNELGKRMLALEQEAHALAGQRFNLGSPKQIVEIFFTQLGLPVLKKTASGAPSTDEEVLEKLAEDFALPVPFWNTAAWPNSRTPIPTSYPAWPTPSPAGCTPITPRP
jgi:DNA polymerase I - 3''-5'' exonuclease and polymerase domains